MEYNNFFRFSFSKVRVTLTIFLLSTPSLRIFRVREHSGDFILTVNDKQATHS